jgi:hypothetical protein
MLSAAIAFQVLQLENPPTIDKVKAVLEKHPWYANQWQARLQDVPAADHGLVLFMQAARWADDIRIRDKVQNRSPWHYVNLPFKPEGQPASVQTRESEPVNILTALAENESVVKNKNDPERKAIALSRSCRSISTIQVRPPPSLSSPASRSPLHTSHKPAKVNSCRSFITMRIGTFPFPSLRHS